MPVQTFQGFQSEGDSVAILHRHFDARRRRRIVALASRNLSAGRGWLHGLARSGGHSEWEGNGLGTDGAAPGVDVPLAAVSDERDESEALLDPRTPNSVNALGPA